MKILPPSLEPWRSKIARRHAPPRARGREGYRQYRQCLRWEFGFTCPFCLCHEADLALEGAEGSGITHVEHWVPVSHDEARINDYTNCFYVCRYCNRSRSARPLVESDGPGHLLNPCETVWESSFSLVGDEIQPRPGDPAALYTLEVYDANDPRKVARRRRRRMAIRQRLDFIRQARRLAGSLLAKAVNTADPELVDVATLLEQEMRVAWQELEHFQAVPADSRCPCACGDEGLCELPRVLEEQLIELDPPFG